MIYLQYSNELYHHGIKGQSWGVRNGPPYPLDRSTSRSLRKMEKSYSRYNKLYNKATKRANQARRKFTRRGRQRSAERAGTQFLRAGKYADKFMRVYNRMERHVERSSGLSMADVFEQYNGSISIEQMFNTVSDFQRTMNQTLESAWVYQRL